MYINNKNEDNELNVLTRDDIDGYLTFDLRTGYVMDELPHNSNDGVFFVMTDYVPNTDTGDFYLEVEEEAG